MTATPDGPTALWRGFIDDPKHGPLPGLLLILTVMTGVVDAVSILSLGRVFVANMTGNVVFVGFAIADAPGFSLTPSLFAMAGFLIGALLCGIAIRRFTWNRVTLFRNSLALEVALLAVALVVSLTVGAPFDNAQKSVLAAIAAIALGVQNAAVRRLAVPDLTTSVLTMTLTGIAADIRAGNRSVVSRRLLAVVTMLIGAICGALLVLHQGPSAGLGVCVGIVAVVLVCAALALRRPAAWHT